ncbi:hypothetical protein HDU99_003386, partial [Rhizoclosmatium hyalinum]
MGVGVGLFDFRRQYVSYAAYHVDEKNKAIHTVFVPSILWSSFAMAAYYEPKIMWAGAIGYAGYYTILHPLIGGSAGVVVLGFAYGAQEFVKHGLEWTGVDPFVAAAGIWVTSWIAQIL